MSKELGDFADYFVKGMAIGGQWAARKEASAIAKERNRLMAIRQAQTDALARQKMGLYAQDVTARVALNNAKAQAALNKGKGGGGGGGAAGNADVDRLRREAREMGIIAGPEPVTPAGNTTVVNNISGDDGDAGQATMPEFNRGGVVRAAGGGSIEADADMSIEEAMAYQKKKGGGGGGTPDLSGFGKMFAKGKGSTPSGSPMAADGVGPGTGYTYAKGGPVKDLTEDPEVEAIKIMPPPPVTPTPVPEYSGSANAGTGSSGDAGGGVSGGTGGIGGNATTGNDSVGTGTGESYARGGAVPPQRVRRFQSGGRVVEAIDTGMSGPGTGYGQRAAPPANARRRY